MTDAIVLVPGLFGFTRLGDLSYFDRVKPLLASSSGISEKDIHELETLPTGSLWRRVALLYDFVEGLRGRGVEKIHLVGHSTGGVDIRLLTNAKYLWPGGPSDSRRTAIFENIGEVISISAPHAGTPIARRLRGTMENVVPLLFLLSILGKAYKSNPLLKVPDAFMFVYASLQKGILPASHVKTALRISGISGETAVKVDRFLDEIVDDHPLIHELTPLAMRTLNECVAGGQAVPVSNFVTVAPPAWTVLGLPLPLPPTLTPVRRFIYSFSYEFTSPDRGEGFETLPAPDPWVADTTPASPSRIKGPQDGVVPAASQTLGASERHSVAALVFGDHLDVVGHYPGKRLGGETVFDSGADFDDTRMAALWQDVGERIKAKSASYGTGKAAE